LPFVYQRMMLPDAVLKTVRWKRQSLCLFAAQ
jgi:hypothetical protein